MHPIQRWKGLCLTQGYHKRSREETISHDISGRARKYMHRLKITTFERYADDLPKKERLCVKKFNEEREHILIF
jgi:hypothetical protein